jgi:site-specific recombinase XerD
MGTVYRDVRSKNPVWSIRYKDADGRHRWERTRAATKTLARRILADREAAVEQAKLQHLDTVDSLLRPKPTVTLRTFSEDYLKHIEAQCSENTARTYKLLLVNRILPALGNSVLSRLNAGAVQKYSDERLAQSSASTVMQELQILSGLFREAMRRELVEKNPIALVTKPRIENQIVRYLSEAEEGRLMERALEPLRSAILVAIHSGLREEEQAALEWADVRSEEGILVIRRTKSKRDRVVPINETLAGVLEGVPRFSKSKYVFTNPDTEDRYYRFNNHPWRKLLVKANVANLRWHDLRHTFGSRLAQSGRSILEIKELMGHRDITVTMRYAHLAPNNLRDAVKALDRKSCQNSSQTKVEETDEVVSR